MRVGQGVRVALWLSLAGCSGPEIELGGGRLAAAEDAGSDAGRDPDGRGPHDHDGRDGMPGDPPCDPAGPYCAPDGWVFPSECEAWRQGEFDTRPCGWDMR